MARVKLVSTAPSTKSGSDVVSLEVSKQGPLTSEEIKALAKKLDELAKFKNPVLEVIDGLVFSIALKTINDLALSKLSPEIQAILCDIVRDIILSDEV